jgi:hypothetical protein
MAKQTLNNGDTKLVYRTKTNDNFTELYDQKAPLASPALTGTPTTPTASYGTNTTQVASTAYVRTEVDTRLSSLVQLFKYRNVRVSSTANITIGSFSVASPIDGVTLVIGDKLLLRHQSTASQNGIYFVTPIGGLSRAEDGDAWNEYPGSLVSVNEGTANADTRWFCTSNDGGTLGSTAITYADATSINVNLTGHVTSVGNAAVLGSFTKAQLNTAVSDGDVLFVGDVSSSSVVVRDIDGSPSLTATTIEFTNGTVTDQGAGVARVTIAGGNETHTGDATGATALTIAANAVTYAKMQDISAASRLLGRGSASGAGDPQEISVGSGLTMSGTTLSASAAGLAEPLIMPSTVMPALEIDVTKFSNTKSISANSTMTFSNATPTAGTRTEVKVTADSTARTLTIPSSYSFARNALITTVLIPANATVSLAFDYTGSRWEVYGDPVGSITRSVQLTAFDYSTNVAVGDGAAYFVVPSALNGMSLVSCAAYAIVAGTTGTTNVQIARIRSGTPVDMLSTVLSIDSTETGTDTAATAAVINASNDDVATHDRIRIDVDAVSTTAPRGLIVVLNFEVL